MGGIFGAVSRSGGNVVPLVVTGLERLKYRGTDNSGIAVAREGRLEVYKDTGPIDVVARKLGLDKLQGSVALGHTRYATHGRPTAENAHPHVDCGRRLAVVGDGSISNYEELKDKVLLNGHRLTSRSDFEVVAHVLEEAFREGRAPEALPGVLSEKLQGFFAVAFLDASTGSIYAATTGPQLFLGASRELFLVSTSKYAMHGFAERYREVRRGEVVRVSSEGVEVYTGTGVEELGELQPLQLDPSLVEKNGYKHHMLREIYEVPESLMRTLSSVQKKYLQLAARLVTGADNVYIIANGTSLHAGMVASYYFSELVGVNPVVVSAAEFPLYYLENIGPGSLVLAISQSGETGDVLSSLYEAKLRGATILGITNYVGSRLARLSNLYLPIAAGPELAVPATKTFTSTLLLLYLVALRASRQEGRIDEDTLNSKLAAVAEAARQLGEWLPKVDSEASRAANEVSECRGGYVVSRGLTYPLALEGALKLKEASYFHAEGVEAGEFKHGPFVLVEKGFGVVFVVPVEKVSAEATYPLVGMALEAGAKVVAVGFAGDQSLEALSEKGAAVVAAPPAERHLAPIVLAVPLQLLAYRLGERLSRPIDSPRYLTKAVTQ